MWQVLICHNKLYNETATEWKRFANKYKKTKYCLLKINYLSTYITITKAQLLRGMMFLISWNLVICCTAAQKITLEKPRNVCMTLKALKVRNWYHMMTIYQCLLVAHNYIFHLAPLTRHYRFYSDIRVSTWRAFTASTLSEMFLLFHKETISRQIQKPVLNDLPSIILRYEIKTIVKRSTNIHKCNSHVSTTHQ